MRQSKTRKQKREAYNKCDFSNIVNDKGMFDTREASNYLGVTVAYIRIMAKSGFLTPVMTYYGNTALYTKRDLDAYNKNHVRDPRKGKRKEEG